MTINGKKQQEAWKALRWFAEYLEPYIHNANQKIVALGMFGGFARGTQGLRSYDKVVRSVRQEISPYPEWSRHTALFNTLAKKSSSADHLAKLLWKEAAVMADDDLDTIATIVTENKYSDIDGKVLINADIYRTSSVQSSIFKQIDEGNSIVEERFDLSPFKSTFGISAGLDKYMDEAKRVGIVEPWKDTNPYEGGNPSTNPHVYSDIVVLTPDEYTNPRWGEIATKKYAYALGWTEKVTGDIAWRNPRNKKEHIRFKLASRSDAIPRTIIIYNSKTKTMREEITVVKE